MKLKVRMGELAVPKLAAVRGGVGRLITMRVSAGLRRTRKNGFVACRKCSWAA